MPERTRREGRKRNVIEMPVIVDRIEGTQVVLEYEGTVFTLPKALLPEEAKEGDVLTINIGIDKLATVDRRRRVKSLEDRLFKHD